MERFIWLDKSPLGDGPLGGEGAIRGGGEFPSSDMACLFFLF